MLSRVEGLTGPKDVIARQAREIRQHWGKGKSVIDRLRFFEESYRLCLADTKYLQYCAGHVEDAIKRYGLKMIYLDTFAHMPLPCYDPSHGHPLGYGRHVALGNFRFVDAILRKFPGLMVACESGAGEYLLGHVHITYHKGIVPVYAIPLFPVVYNGYMQYTNWWMWPPYETDDDFTSMLAYGTHLGYLPGGAVAGGIIAQFARGLKEGPSKVMVDFFHRTVSARLLYSDFICAGDRLKTPVLRGVPVRTHRWSLKSGQYAASITLPRVQASLWRHGKDPSKELLLLSNDSSQAISITLDGTNVEIPPFSWRGIERRARK